MYHRCCLAGASAAAQPGLPSPARVVPGPSPAVGPRLVHLTRTRQDIRELLHGQGRPVAAGDLAMLHPRPSGRAAVRRPVCSVCAVLHRGDRIVMRTYFEKLAAPWAGRTGAGPAPGRQRAGERRACTRPGPCWWELLRMGMPAATGIPGPAGAAWSPTSSPGAPSARAPPESQTHREMASGLGLPVGFRMARTARWAWRWTPSRQPACRIRRLGINLDGQVAQLSTRGNPPDGHLILRGGRTPNYQAGPVADAAQAPGRAPAACPAGGGLQPWQQPEAARPPDACGRRPRPAHRCRRPSGHGRDGGKSSAGRRPAAAPRSHMPRL